MLHLDGTTATIDYEPAESTTGMFGGNSNWRGPIWFPLNYLVISCLLKYHSFFGEDFTVEYPTGSGEQAHARARSPDDLGGGSSRSSPGARTGGGPATAGSTSCSTTRSGGTTSTSTSTSTGTTAAGLGASHQTGWTGLIADIIRRRHGAVPETADLIHDLLYPGDDA